MANPDKTGAEEPIQSSWILGVDVGQRSVGLAAVEVDEENSPNKILSAVTVIHDGGVGNERTQESRLAQAGIARRLHRLRRRRRSRLNKVDRLIEQLGWTLPPPTGEHPYAAWEARKRLVEQPVPDEEDLKVLLGRAISHIARHRGWRNPWLSLAVLQKLDAPSLTLRESIEKVREATGASLEPETTLGQLGALLLNHPGLRVNPGGDTGSLPALLAGRARQEDLLWELKLIWEMQGINSTRLEEVIEAVFSQTPPSVPKERIGIDPLSDSGQVRAPVACLEFQLFRILDKVANLRVLKNGRKVPLTVDQRSEVLKRLLDCGENRITWAEVATDILGLPTEADLVVPEEQRVSSVAPRDETTTAFEKYLKDNRKKLEKTKVWWEQSGREERAALIGILIDSEDTDERGISTLLPQDELALLAELPLPAGRAAYGRNTLQRLNEKMIAEPLDLHEARKACFGVSNDWHPPLPRLDEVTGNPTVDRNLAVVRKFLASAELRWGPPKRIVIEIVREAEQSPAKLKEGERRRAKRREANERAREELRASGLPEPTRADLNRKKLLSLYNCRCLYCGESITWETSELDHIVPRKDGGSNRLENLAAVCVSCNQSKSRLPFGLYAKQGNVDLQEVLARVYELRYERGGIWESPRELASYKQAVKARLRRLTEDPEEIRPMEPTSYAATALRDRIKRYAEELPSQPDLLVISGGMTAEARWVLGIDTATVLKRPGFGKRIDRRQHAVDALVLTTLRLGVVQQLLKRRNLRTQQEFYKGRSGVDFSSWKREVQNQDLFRDWIARGEKISDLLAMAIVTDTIPVMQPLRLSPRGQLHEETGSKLDHLEVGAAWSEDDIRRIVNPRAYMAMLDLAGDQGQLEQDANRILRFDEKEQTSNDKLDLFPYDRAMMQVGTWAVDMGEIHHARVYAWRSKSGKITYGWLRVWLADLAACGLLKPGVDVFSEPLPPWSQSWRHADSKLRDALKAGSLVCLGWLVKGDELEFRTIASLKASGSLSDFLSRFPERRWVISSFEASAQATLKPRYLAKEGLDENNNTQPSELDEDSNTQPKWVTIIKRGWRPMVNNLLSSDGLIVIRRSALGVPRWKSSHLPISWSPSRRAEELLP